MYIRVRDVNKSFKSLSVLKNISFDIEKGDIVGLMGSSGSGKSTLLNLISGLDIADSGEIFFSGEDICKINSKQLSKFRKDSLGFVFQDYNLIDTLTADENIALALSMKKSQYSEIQEKVDQAMEILKITHIKDKFPYQLSGGEKQRIACARALVKSPALILADEPTGALDSKSADNLMQTFLDINKRLNVTIFVVTHDTFTASYCKRVLFMENGKIEGVWEREGRSKNEFFNIILRNLNEKRGW